MAVVLSGYQIGLAIYTGTRTLVYRGVRESDNKPVVIKFLRNEYPNFSELLQFRNQYTIAKNLNIPGIIRPDSLEPYGNSYALVMADVGGISLREYSKIHSLEVAEVLTIALKLTEILHDLHAERVIHKDIKPANILINPETKQVKLIDFSIASLLPRETQEILNPNVLEGTLAYISPEQTGRMNRGIDYRSDFYSLGVTFYELLTGKLPFVSDDPMELVHFHLAKQPNAIHTIKADIPIILSQIVGKLMAKNAENRYQSALGVKHDLEICLVQLKETGKIDDFEIGKRDLTDRFIIPEKLYGRETEVETLLQAFDRVANPPQPLGGVEIMLVAGFSGIGKTAIVNEVHKPIVQQRGYFIKGKFDQFNRNIPFSAFVQAFRDLMGQLLSESDVQLAAWKAKILAAVGENGEVIVDVIPELEQIIAPQPPVPELSGNASQNRFNLLFQKFISVFTTKEHPLVMFLDDLQWVDSASLNLLNLLMSEASSGYLLILGAYRDNEVFPAHPLMLTLEQIQKARAIVNTITLKPLVEMTVNQLVSDTLGCTAELAQPLTQLVYQKTKGNPFFTTQFLKALHEDGWIEFTPTTGAGTGATGGWQCDMVAVRQLALSSDVVEFMALQLQKLPVETQEVLKLAACIGNQFDLNTLAIVSEQSPIETATNLWKALQEGLILPISETYKFFQANDSSEYDRSGEIAVPYKFLHDRVQQAAYSLIAEDRKQATHLSIGQLLLRDSSSSERQERLFEIVNHLNIGIALITSLQERENLAELNLTAGQKAKTATAYTAAIEYLATAIELLPADAWESHYPLTLALHEGITEASYLNTDFEQMEGWASVVLQQAKTLLDNIKVQQTRIMGTKAQGQFLNAIEIGLQVLHSLGIEFPEQPTQEDIGQAFGAGRSLWADKAPHSLLDLPTMSDPQLMAAMEILTVLVSAAYMSASNLMPLLIFKQVELSILFGNCPVSVFAYGDYGLILCGIMGDIDNGYEFGELALSLRDRLQLTSFKPRIFYVVHRFIKHWKKPLSEILIGFQETYRCSLETGEIEVACLSAVAYCYYAYYTGIELTGIAGVMDAYRQTIDRYQHAASRYSQEIYYQTVLNLSGQADVPDRLTGIKFNQEKSLYELKLNNQRSALFDWYFNQTILYYLFGKNAEATQTSAQMAQYLDGALATFLVPLYSFYDALIQLTQYGSASPEDRHTILFQVQQHQDKLHNWATLAPTNHQHRLELVAADKYRVLGNKTDAIEAYDRAISSAKANNFIQDEALANELAAKFYLDWGKEKVAAGYMQEAYYCYAKWGAKAKTDDLETRYPQLLQRILQQANQPLSVLETLTTASADSIHSSSGKSNASKSLNHTLDFAALLKVSQTLSSTIELDELLQTLTQAMLKNSGANKCALMLCQEGEWQVRAIADLEQTTLQAVPLENKVNNLPFKLIQYVKNTLIAIVMDDLDTDLPVIGNYFIQHHPKSVLCLPILNQGKLVGILYLENQTTSGVFTGDRILILNFLCTQAAISLENARLYQNLQQSEHSEREKAEQLAQTLELLQIENRKLAFRSDVDAAFTRDDSVSQIDISEKEYETLDLYEHKSNFRRCLMLQSCTEAIVKHLNVAFARIWTLNQDENVLELQASAGQYTHLDGSHSRIPVGKFKIGLIAQERRPHLTNNVLNDPRVSNKVWAQQEGMIAFAGYPLIVEDRLVGVVAMFARQFLSDEILQMLMLVADGIASGIRRKQVEQALQQSDIQIRQKAKQLENALQQLEQSQVQLVQSEKMSALGNLVAGVAHEINNPIGCIVGNVGAAQDYINDLLNIIDLYGDKFPQPGADIEDELEAIDLDYVREDLPKLIKAMKDGGSRITSISNSLRTFSRSDSDTKQKFNLHDGIDSTVLILRHRLKANDNRPAIEVITEYGKIPEVSCFPGQLNQVFMNILANAIDVLDESNVGRSFAQIKDNPNRITIQTSVIDRQVKITIADNGMGMSELVKQKIFDHLFTTKGVGKGTGLGLAIARQIIIEKHGGAIEVNSQLGEGTIFTLQLPIAA